MAVGLQLANRNDYVSVQDHINNNLTNLEEMIDNNSGKKITGYIQDEGEKILGNYYLDKLATGLFKCIKSGNINYNSADYFEDYSNYANGDKLNNLTKTSSLIVANSNVELSFGTLHKTGNIVSTSIEFRLKENLEISSSPEHILLFRIPNEFIPKINPRIYLFPMKVRTDVSSDNYILELFVKNTGEISLGGFQGEKVSVLRSGLYFQSSGSWGC